MIEHKKRVIFYPMQLRDFVRDHGAELPIGIPVAYDTIKPERYCIVRPNRFRFYHELCGANGLPLNFFISMRHIFTGASELRSSLRNFESQNEYGYKPCIKRRFQNAETLQSRNQTNSS